MTNDTTLEARLTEAEDALHKLTMGQSEVSIEYEGFKATYAQSSPAKLHRYIARLRRKLGKPTASRARRVTF